MTEKSNWRVEQIISGGQTGVDRVGLEVAHKKGIVTGGTAPLKFMTSNGADLSLRQFGLKELDLQKPLSLAAQYIARSQLNVDAANATIVFKCRDSPGTDKTAYYAVTHHWPYGSFHLRSLKNAPNPWRPCLIVNVFGSKEDALISEVRDFLNLHRPQIVNIAGHRHDNTSQSRIFLAIVHRILTAVLHDESLQK